MAKILVFGMIILVVLFGGIALIAHQLQSPKSPAATSDTSFQPIQNQQTQNGNTAITSQTQSMPTPTPINLLNVPRVSANSALIHTTKGDIAIQLYPQDAPKTVTNFATLATVGYYNGLLFHRVVPGFVIQGGDPNGDGTGGVSIYGPTFEDELNASSSSYQAGYLEGVVAMANRGPNTNGSQFFIMLADNATLPHSYTIFGKVTQGMDVVKKIQVGDKMLQISVQQ